ncbi:MULTISPECIES: DUF6745 domain-containing protein [unclassified Microcoleus]|uniref:DUF6745 domain-containing protein n=1 Tax=unclassified Microcoleus TaxID=2642155 RepID=UPI002FD5E7A2
MIEKLTPEQEKLILVYDEKWRKLIYSTAPIDREKAAKAVKQAYLGIDEKEPEIIFCSSPYEGANLVLGYERAINQLYEEFGVNLVDRFNEEVYDRAWSNFNAQISEEVYCQINLQFWTHIDDFFRDMLDEKLYRNQDFLAVDAYSYIDPILWAEVCAFCDFFVSVLKCNPNGINWQALLFFTTQCGWIFPYEKVCIVCDRPRIFSFDSQHRLHAEGGPAIQFSDGYSIYSYHGVTLPEKYGKLHPHEWQSQWVLEEENAEIRRVLIQGIGYDRIARELAAVELDTWQEYTLLKIDTKVDVEPIYLLKMTCPSTGFIHALRVPPDINSAREAIKWVNWGVDYEDFSVQT